MCHSTEQAKKRKKLRIVHLSGRWGAQQVPPLRSPEFLSRLVALANFMRLSLMKAAHVDLSGAA
jgi:hypothetical protein